MKVWNEISQAQRIERWEQCLRVLQELTRHQRRKNWDMSEFGYITECGTVACAAGHCGLDPWFRRRGFKLDLVTRKSPLFSNFYISDTRDFFAYHGSEKIFYNSTSRPVGRVIREVKQHIKWLRSA